MDAFHMVTAISGVSIQYEHLMLKTLASQREVVVSSSCSVPEHLFLVNRTDHNCVKLTGAM
jgi:hypothetical protein